AWLRRADRGGEGVHPAAGAAAPLDPVSVGHRGRTGTARLAVLLGYADLSAREDRREHPYGQLERSWPDQGPDADRLRCLGPRRLCGGGRRRTGADGACRRRTGERFLLPVGPL